MKARKTVKIEATAHRFLTMLTAIRNESQSQVLEAILGAELAKINPRLLDNAEELASAGAAGPTPGTKEAWMQTAVN